MATYGYIRVSTLQQANEGDSLESQLKQIGSCGSLKGFDIPSESFVTERGVSGSLEFENRPEGVKLFNRLELGDVLIFSKLDRAFRNTRNAYNLTQPEWRKSLRRLHRQISNGGLSHMMWELAANKG
jgi:putative DNA-invertase from lambdoid prophage Rac